MQPKLFVTHSFTPLYRRLSAALGRRKTAVADSRVAPLPYPLPIRWGEGKDLNVERVQPSDIDRSQKLFFFSLAPSDGEWVRERGNVHLLLGRFSFCGLPAGLSAYAQRTRCRLQVGDTAE